MEQRVRLWLAVKELGELLGDNKMWGSFEWLDKTLGSECPKLDPVSMQLLSDKLLRAKLKEITKIYGRISEG